MAFCNERNLQMVGMSENKNRFSVFAVHMNRVKCKSRVSMAVSVLAAMSIFADVHVWTGARNDWDWTDGVNFDGGAPSTSDVVEIPAGRTVQVKDSASATIVASLAQVKMLAEDGKDDGKIVFDMGDSDLTINCALGMMADNDLTGSVVKKGNGTLTFANSEAFAYMACLSIEKGTVRHPDATSGYRYGPVDIASGATLVTSPNATTLLYGLTGAGLVTNEVTSGYKNMYLNRPTSGSGEKCTHDFSGRIAGLYYYESSGRVLLRGGNNVFSTTDFTIYSTSTSVRDLEMLAARVVGVTGVATLGLKGSPSSVGIDNNIRTLNYGGGLLYLGTGDETDRSISVLRPNMGISFIDGGATGNLVWKGDIVLGGNPSNNGMGIFGLIGSNATACVFSGAMPTRTYNTTNYCFFVEKAGSGVWRFADAADNRTQRAFWTSMAVKNGTLQFDSMEEAGTPCALGLATNLTASYYGLRNDAAHPGPYAYWLGSSGKTVTFEFTGTNGAYATRRPIALEGDAKLKNDTPHPWRFSGVAPTTSGAKVLYLSGSGHGESEIAGIADTAASSISIVKEGAGQWTLNGSNTFSGTVSVNGGTLRIRRDPGSYTWFRWTIMNKGANTASDLYLVEFALSDEDGNRVNTGLTFTNNWCGTLPGQIALPRIGDYRISSGRGITNLVDGKTDVVNICYFRDGTTTLESPETTKPNTWIPILMRLPEGVNPAKYYDVCIHSNAQGKNNPNTWKVEGSPDGIHWTELHRVENQGLLDVSVKWLFADHLYYESKKYYESGKDGHEIATRPTWSVSPAFTNTVSVVRDATLKAIGEVELSSIKIDASNAGTIDGFSLAENGELEIVNLGSDGTVEGMFTNAVNLYNLKNWTLSVNGKGSGSKKLVVNQDGTLRVVTRGIVFSVR